VRSGALEVKAQMLTEKLGKDNIFRIRKTSGGIRLPLVH
tara:strand:+ start:145 stop:261 length:117 start_codon:yes stop_codon:yes gene_type:complete